MENDCYNANNLEEYHNQIIEKIKNSDFGNLYEKNKQIITDNLRKYCVINSITKKAFDTCFEVKKSVYTKIKLLNFLNLNVKMSKK